MKKYFVIGNPIDHSLSPKLHNHWFKESKINAVYDKKKIDENNIKTIIFDLKEKKINGINVTVPFKKNSNSLFRQIEPRSGANTVSKYNNFK